MRFRSLLISPATRTDRAARLVEAAADLTVLDLEDGVAVADKARARSSVVELARSVKAAAPGRPLLVRVNPTTSPWFEDDAAAALEAGVHGLVIPKVGRVDDAAVVRSLRADHPDLLVVVGIETAAGVQRVEALLGAEVFSAVYFGAEDLVADLGGVRTRAGLEVLYARSRVVLAARVAGVPALDQVVAAFDDDQAFARDAHTGRSLGFAGKLCIHPRQVRLAHQVFTPSAREVARAERLLAAFKAAGGDAGGVAVFDGEMIDGPAVRHAQGILDRVDPPIG